MKQIVLTIEQMKHLESLGLDTRDASMYYKQFKTRLPNGNIELRSGSEITNSPLQGGIPAYTLEDILDKLPHTLKDGAYVLEILFNNIDNTYEISYQEDAIDRYSMECSDFSDPSLLQAAYKLLLHCIEKKYIKVSKTV